MAKKLKFDLLKVILFIEDDAKLRKFFADEFGDDFKHHIKSVKQGSFGKDATQYAKLMFNDYICANEKYAQQYNDSVIIPETTETTIKTNQQRAIEAIDDLLDLAVIARTKVFDNEDAKTIIATVDTVKRNYHQS